MAKPSTTRRPPHSSTSTPGLSTTPPLPPSPPSPAPGLAFDHLLLVSGLSGDVVGRARRRGAPTSRRRLPLAPVRGQSQLGTPASSSPSSRDDSAHSVLSCCSASAHSTALKYASPTGAQSLLPARSQARARRALSGRRALEGALATSTRARHKVTCTLNLLELHESPPALGHESARDAATALPLPPLKRLRERARLVVRLLLDPGVVGGSRRLRRRLRTKVLGPVRRPHGDQVEVGEEGRTGRWSARGSSASRTVAASCPSAP